MSIVFPKFFQNIPAAARQKSSESHFLVKTDLTNLQLLEFIRSIRPKKQAKPDCVHAVSGGAAAAIPPTGFGKAAVFFSGGFSVKRAFLRVQHAGKAVPESELLPMFKLRKYWRQYT